MIFGFQITHKLHGVGHSVVYRAIRSSDNRPVVMKVLDTPYPTPRELARYRQEYEIIAALDAPDVTGVIRAYSLEKHRNTLIIVLEDFGGISLDRAFEHQPPSVERFLDLAIQTSAALAHIHQRGVIHKDINPSNLVWNARSNQLKIIDFGIATLLSSESPTLQNPNVLEGTLAYVSPEQTGRMNRRLDYRTDFYSLGVTFYQLLTGQLPFDKQDALELVHCHIAAQPRPPIELREDVPPMLSRLIMKMLSKNAEERCQSARGLTLDLEACRALLAAGEPAEMPALSCADVSDRFEIPQHLYGRSRETETLLQAFERVAQGRSEVVLVTGYSGIGKSSLVRELYKPITKQNAFFVSGKFDMLQRATPYSALSATFSLLVKQLLTGTGAALRQWRDRLLAALGPNGRILTDLIPELALVIGPQPEVEALGPVEAQNRLNLALRSFIRVFCQADHPLVIFLDDLQWADAATLRLLEPLQVDAELHHFLLIGAYRDNEVDAAHPLSSTLARLHQRHVSISRIHLQPLAFEDIARLLADTLHRVPEPSSTQPSVGALAELVLTRTGGNPFFVGQFLHMLHDEGFLRFDAALPGWRWNMTEIEATPVTDNVVDLLRSKLRKLPESILTPLRLAACIGSRFDLSTLAMIAAMIASRSLAETSEALMQAVREGYLHPTSEPELLSQNDHGGPHAPLLAIREYRFVHDRVQQATYALLPEAERGAIHLDIGRILLTKLSPVERDERLFELVDHLNLGRSLLADAPEQGALTALELARLNLAAGKRAMAATAYGAAAGYLETGIELAGQAWNQDHDLLLSLYMEGAHAAHCSGDFERSQALIDIALDQAAAAVIKAQLYQTSIVQYTNQARYEEAFRVAREALALLGQSLPPADQIAAAAKQELTDTGQRLDEHDMDTLAAAPAMTDPIHRAAMEIFSTLAPTAFQTSVAMFDFVSARMVALSLAHGQTVAGAHAYALYAMVLIRHRDYQRAYELGELAMRVAARLGSAAARCKAGEVVIAHIHHWARPFRSSEPINAEAYEAGLQSGELQYAAFTLMYRLVSHFYQGEPLARILDEARAFSQFGRANQNTVVTNTIEAFRLAAAHLAGARASDAADASSDSDSGSDSGSDSDAHAAFVARCHEESCFFALGVYAALRCQVLYLCQDYEQALEAAIEGTRWLDYIPGVVSEAAQVFYHSLCLTALYPERSPAQQAAYWQTLEANQAQMQVWAESCPENFRHMHLLVAAEMARITGDDFTAVERYTQAIRTADDSQICQDHALANELAARFWLAKQQTPYATFHLREAHYGYSQWGAERKVAMLEQHPAQLLMRSWGMGAQRRKSDSGTDLSITTSSTSSTAEQLDLSSMIKASQALSGEIALDKLLARLIDIVIENAGAQHGCLLLKRQDRLVIEAMGTLGGPDVKVLQSLPLQEQGGAGAREAKVSTAIVNYVLRSGETVVLHDAAHEGAFMSDPYVLANKPRSILCMPLLNQGRVNGVVYLENKLSPHAFTPERVALLHILSSQMTISLDNSFLYDNLHQANQNLERLLYSIAHDLKEPLRAIQSFSELLTRRYGAHVDDTGRDYLRRIVNAGQHLGGLLDAIRTIAEIRHAEGTRALVPCEQLLQQAMARLRPEIARTQAHIRIAPDLPQCMVERRWASEALYRILSNALRYTRADTPPEIDIDAYEGPEGLGLVIRDRGPGIPEEHAEAMFELFRRLVGREIAGAGAGLAITRQIALKHGGNTWLRPRPGGGTELYITFGR